MLLRSNKLVTRDPTSTGKESDQRQERPSTAPLLAPGPQEMSSSAAITPPSPSTPGVPQQLDPVNVPSHAATTCKSLASGCSTRSTIKARQLTLKAEHARRVAELENKVAEREKAAMELELQAELAALESGASGSSKSRSRVVNWLDSIHHNAPQGDASKDATCERRQNEGQKASEQQQPHPRPPYDDTQHALNSLGTPMNKNCSYKNKEFITSQATHTQQNDIQQLAQAITDLTRSRPKVSDFKLPSFSGRTSDWLPFKTVFNQTKSSYSAAENLARLNLALSGIARDMVSSLLISACNPEEVLSLLETRFGRPEFIVLQEISTMQSLPKLSSDYCKDLDLFACRVQNCVKTIQLLNRFEYLASPELFNNILSKFTPLLRSRWTDYASGRTDRKYKLELLADFLTHEANLQIQFGLIIPPISVSNYSPTNSQNLQFHNRDVKQKSQRDFTKKRIDNNIHTVCEDNLNFSDNYTGVTDSNSSSLCLFCKLENHTIDKCPKFELLSVDDRWRWANDNKVCRRCLKRGGHLYRRCKVSCKIGNCTLKHNSLLHRTKTSEVTSHVEAVQPSTSLLPSKETDEVLVAHTTPGEKSSRPLLKVVAVTVSGPKGEVNTFALLDDGSTTTLADSSVMKAIGAEGPQSTLTVNCIGGLSTTCEASFVEFSIRGRYCTRSHIIKNVRSIPNLGISRQSLYQSDIQGYDYLSDIADLLCYDNVQPTILIGVDNWNLTIAHSTRKGTSNQPVAIETALGWLLYGFQSSKSSLVHFINHAVVSNPQQDDSSLEHLIKENYKLDSIGIIKKDYRNPEDERAINILNENTRRLPSGRFETGLLWRSELGNIPDSRTLALSRFRSLERKFRLNPDYASSYKANIESIISKNYAELCPAPPTGKITWYLPHFGVIHPQKKKLRVVHDAAALVQGVSLNSLLLQGPDILQPLLAILMRFREGRVALNADIREMFPQTKIRAEDRDAQRFFWRFDPSQPIAEYRMSSMIFGATSSPFTALFLKNKNAEEHRQQFPAAAEAIINDTYMDDYLGSIWSVQEAARLASDIVHVHSQAKLEMRSWVSNCKEALALLPVDLCASNTTPVAVRVLGQSWNVSNDVLYFSRDSLSSLPTKLTKRSVLSFLMKVYDPLGFLTPIVIRGRIYFQQTWRKNLDWDQQLPPDLASKWGNWFSELQRFCALTIPRCYVYDNNHVDCQLHVFADASEHAYACVAFWRFQFANADVKLSLIGGKARLAPLKPASIPRLELQAALIASRLASYIVEAHRIKPNKIYLWSDSITVLRWLRSDARAFKSFVAHRIGEILESTNISSWKYVPSGHNVADDATRPDAKFDSCQRWYTGPSFLLLDEKDWPVEPSSAAPSILDERKTQNAHHLGTIGLTTTTPHELPSLVVADYRRFSNWLRLVRANARVNKCREHLKSLLLKIRSKSPSCSFSSKRRFHTLTLKERLDCLPNISAEDITISEKTLFHRSQLESFKDEILATIKLQPVSKKSRLARITVIVDENKALRMSSRTGARGLPALGRIEDPMVLDGNHPIVRLFIYHYHQKFMHGYNEAVVNELRQQYHIIHLRPSVRAISKSCHFCRRRKASPFSPPVGDLPEDRITPSRPFSKVGIDYFGPITITIGRRVEKRYVALFTCLVVRAVHLELVYSLTADSAIMALRRFFARRGYPDKIYSDNGTAFVGAAGMLQEVFNFTSSRKISWIFIPPAAPFMGGCWERLVRSIKTALSATLKTRSPNEEILRTLLLEAEAVVNSRPLTHVPVDFETESALTPFHFILGTSSNDPPLRPLEDSDLIGRREWKKGLRLADHFWQRWTKEYLPQLRPRPITKTASQPTLGDVVIVVDGSLPRSTWPLGKVTRVWPGKDGVVRVVEVRTKGGTLKRPSKMLVPLCSP